MQATIWPQASAYGYLYDMDDSMPLCKIVMNGSINWICRLHWFEFFSLKWNISFFFFWLGLGIEQWTQKEALKINVYRN